MNCIGILKKHLGLLLFIILPLWLWQGGVGLAENKPPVTLDLVPNKQIFSIREGVVMKFIFTAQSKTKLCLHKDILSQVQVRIARPGLGELALKPMTLTDNSQIFHQPLKVIWLEPGESLTVRANLKRFQFDRSEQWTPGEYSVNATFNLCEQTPATHVTDSGVETPVKSSRQGWFMIMI